MLTTAVPGTAHRQFLGFSYFLWSVLQEVDNHIVLLTVV